MAADPAPNRPPTRPRRLAGVVLAGALLVGACSTVDADVVDSALSADEALISVDDSNAEAMAVSVSAEAGGVFDASTILDIAIEIDPDEYQEAIAAYLENADKEWIEASVRIDGVTYSQVGIRLKGNSSLRVLTADSEPESLPWLIRFDKYIDGQNHEGYFDLVVRSNSSTTSLNEALALDLLAAAGLASQDAVFTNLSVNGSDGTLRLVIEHPDDVWMDETFGDDGALYKAESTGDYSYRGDDPDSYDEVFDQEAGKDNVDLTPLMDFLDFINSSDDATFAAELSGHLDVETFADYLAMMDLVDNLDDIDGPGNNSYLHYDPDTDTFTVVPWDMNLAFGVVNVDGGGPGGEGVGGPQDRPEGFGPDHGGPGGPMGSNVLAERFHADESFEALYQEALIELRASLFDSGAAAALLEARVATLAEAGDLVDSATLQTEAATMAAAIS